MATMLHIIGLCDLYRFILILKFNKKKNDNNSFDYVIEYKLF